VDDVYAIVPVKPLEEGKSRLREILSAHQRTELNSFLMNLTFEQAAIFPGVSRTIVVSRSEMVLAAAASRGMIPLLEEAGDLNGALTSASRKAKSLNARSVLILPVDLPLVRAVAIKRFIEQYTNPVCMMAPDRHRRGTNLLYLSPIYDDFYRFGPDSLQNHQDEAKKRNMQVFLLEDETFAIDIDESADYRLWKSRVESDQRDTS